MERKFYIKAILLLVVGLIYSNCFAQEEFEGFPYDPEGATITTDKEIRHQIKRTIGYSDDGIWISNEFSGARVNDLRKIDDNHFQIRVKPEIQPINNSPWYAFQIRGDSSRTITLEITYDHGIHRYKPKISTDGKKWVPISAKNYATASGSAKLTLEVSENPLWISGQELITAEIFNRWSYSLATHPEVSLQTIGYSHDGNPLRKIKIASLSGSPKKGVLILTGRQHPPEISGALACKAFIETLASDHPVAIQFRQHFEVWAYPFSNPDGVHRGHWRQNAVGVDLNRDWKAFNQPETKSIRNDLLKLKKDSLRMVYYGVDFHSTNKNIFYPIKESISTFPEDFTYQWLDTLRHRLPTFDFDIEPFDTKSPIMKNWIYHTFGADAVTYEMDDAIDREELGIVARESALIIMQQLLKEKTKKNSLLSQGQ